MHHLQPRRVAAGALQRWLTQALELASRHFWLWLITTALFYACACLPPLLSLATPVLDPLMFPLLVIVGILGSAFGPIIAAYADRRLNPNALRRYPRTTAPWRYLRQTLTFLFIPFAITVLLGLIAALPTQGNRLAEQLSAGPIPFVLAALTLGSLAFTARIVLFDAMPKTHLHRLLATVLLGLSWEASEPLVNQGCELNHSPLTQLCWNLALPLLLIALLSMLLPAGYLITAALSLLSFPLGSSLLYVSFRDIYLGQAENSAVLIPRPVPAPTLEHQRLP